MKTVAAFGSARRDRAGGRGAPRNGTPAAAVLLLAATSLLADGPRVLAAATPVEHAFPTAAVPAAEPTLSATVKPPAGPPSDRGAARPDTADDASLDARTARVADQLRCPVCRSQSVLESSSTLAREMKAEIRRRLGEGQSPEEVKAYFVSRYGEWILLRPEPEGLNLVVYVVPPLLLLGGGILVWWLVRRWRPRTTGRPASAGPEDTRPDAGPESPAGDGLSPEEERRLQRAMEEARSEG